MKLIIDRDSVCAKDNFNHQQVIECDDDETLESLMNKILQTNFFPVEDFKNLTEKWEVIVSNSYICTYSTIDNTIDSHFDKNCLFKNLNIKNIYFKSKQKPYISKKHTIKNFLLSILFICLLCFNIVIVIIPILYIFSIRNDAFDTCLDTGFCKSGIEINTEHGKIKINKQNCLKYKWEWYEKDNTCFLNNE